MGGVGRWPAACIWKGGGSRVGRWYAACITALLPLLPARRPLGSRHHRRPLAVDATPVSSSQTARRRACRRPPPDAPVAAAPGRAPLNRGRPSPPRRPPSLPPPHWRSRWRASLSPAAHTACCTGSPALHAERTDGLSSACSGAASKQPRRRRGEPRPRGPVPPSPPGASYSPATATPTPPSRHTAAGKRGLHNGAARPAARRGAPAPPVCADHHGRAPRGGPPDTRKSGL